MIVVAYKILDGLKQETKTVEIDFCEGITPAIIGNDLKIKNYHFVKINEFKATRDDPVSDGDKVTFIPYITGG